MPVLNHLRVSIENATRRYDEFDDKQSHDQSTIRNVQTCFEVEHDQHFKIVLTTLRGFFWPRCSNGFIVTIDFDEGTKVNRYEVVLAKELDLEDPTAPSTCTIDSLVLPKFDIHERFYFRFIEMRDDDNKNYQTWPSSCDFQGRIRIEVRRVKIEARRNSTTRDFGEPKKVKRAPKALLRRNKITHEIDLVPGEELYDHTDKPFRSTSVKGGQVGIFIFRYSGAGMFERLNDEDSDTSELQEPSREPPKILRDAYLVYEKKDGENDETAAVTDEMHTDVAQDKICSLLGAEAAQVATLPSSDLVEFDESGMPMEDVARLSSFDKELEALEADIAGLKRQAEERKQEVAGVLQKRKELYEKLAKLVRQSVAKLQADIDEDQRKVDSKKRKLDQMVEKQAQLQSAKRVRDMREEEA